jgi:homoserine kinase
MHQPFRLPLVPGLEAAIEAAGRAGALGACLSGAGSAVLVFLDSASDGAPLLAAVCAFAQAGVKAEGLRLRPATDGAHVNWTS